MNNPRRAVVATRSQLGYALAVIGIVLVALNLRAAVSAVTPIYDQIGKSFTLTTTAIGVLGMLPTLSFAVLGAVTPRFVHRLGIEQSLLLAMGLVCLGEATRALAGNVWLFGLLSFVCLGGMGMGNVLLPPAIKHYFPQKIGILTSIYTTLTAISAAAPSLVAVPVTAAVGWRISIGMWSLLALIALLPWAVLVRGHHKPAKTIRRVRHAAWRWPTTWAVTLIFAVGALNTFAMMNWLPKILNSSAGASPAVAATMLAMYNLVGIPHSLVVPVLLSRIRRPYAIILFASACLLVGYAGLAFALTYAWGWIVPAGLGLMCIPIGLTLINLRSRTEDGTTALSGFVQGVGYLLAAPGPVIVGELRSLTGGWTAAFGFLMATALVAAVAGAAAVRPRFIEDA